MLFRGFVGQSLFYDVGFCPVNAVGYLPRIGDRALTYDSYTRDMLVDDLVEWVADSAYRSVFARDQLVEIAGDCWVSVYEDVANRLLAQHPYSATLDAAICTVKDLSLAENSHSCLCQGPAAAV